MKNIIKTVVFSIFLALLPSCNDNGNDTPANVPERILFNGAGEDGIFDPSLAKDPDSSRIWMSYSEVDNSIWPHPATGDYNKLVHTRMAWSDNAGVDWTDCGIVINTSFDMVIQVVENGEVIDHKGTWVHEVSAIVYDPGDPDENKRWKMLWHHYLFLDGGQLFDHGWIGMKTAPSPHGTWSEERKLIVGSIYNPVDDAIIGPPEIHLDTLHTDLNGCLAFTEPGLIAANNALYLCMLGAEVLSTNGRIILLKSVDHGNSWSYLGTMLLNSADGPALDYHGYSAPAMFCKNGKYYLIVTPQINNFYMGMLVFEITDLENATIKRDGDVPSVIMSVFGTDGSFNGAAGYVAESTGSGIIYGQAFIDETPRFRMFKSNINLQ